MKISTKRPPLREQTGDEELEFKLQNSLYHSAFLYQFPTTDIPALRQTFVTFFLSTNLLKDTVKTLDKEEKSNRDKMVAQYKERLFAQRTRDPEALA